MLHGPSAASVDVHFSVPAVCAAQVETGFVDIGLVPVAEVARQGLEIVPGTCIAAQGAVRSILLFTRVPWKNVRTLAADNSSRTSVQLARVILRERFGADPEIGPCAPELDRMLEVADAALIIGDPALRLDPAALPYESLDLAEEWNSLTRLPFVFATWAGKPDIRVHKLAGLTLSSYRFGQERLDEIVKAEAGPRGISEQLADRYLRHHLWFTLGEREQKGMDEFFKLAGLGLVGV